MYISYFDESGDDGYPVKSSELFILTNIYMYNLYWQENYDTIVEFRRQLKKEYNFPVKQEFHTRAFLTDKLPYHGKYEPQTRKEILNLFFNLVSGLKLKIINTAIDKQNIKKENYKVLENAFKYNIQRIENDLSRLEPNQKKYIIITDEGRISMLRNVAREIRKINYIPSKFSPFAYRKEIQNLIEDPLPKESSQSYFIQLADMIAKIVYLYVSANLSSPRIEWANRIKNVLTEGDEIELLDIIKNVLNRDASPDKYGIVYYPK